MSAVVEEPTVLEVVFAESGVYTDTEALERNQREIMSQNRAASAVENESFAAFLDLLSAADTDYIDAAATLPQTAEPQLPPLDWDAVSAALSESQAILQGVQELLSETFAAMGIPDHQFIRVYADMNGDLRLLADHPRREEMETVLNSPENQDLRQLYQAAVSGMGLAGGLVGTMSVPAEVLEKVKAKHSAA